MSIYRRILHAFALCLALASPHVKAVPLLFGEITPTAPLFTNLDPTYWTQTVLAPNQWAFTKTSAFTSTFAPLGDVPTYSLAWLEPDGSTNFNVLVVGADNESLVLLSDVPFASLAALPLFIPPAVLDSEFLSLVVPIFDPSFAPGEFFDTVAFVDVATAAELIEPPSLALVGLALVAVAGLHSRRRRHFQHAAKS